LHDELGFEMQHPKAQRLKPSIAASVSAEPSSVIEPIDFDDEATGGSEKVDSVGAEHDLPPERDPELTTGKPSPEPSPEARFRERWRRAHDASAFVE
jgi:hypothetical protein